MSEMMDEAVLNMPYELAMGSEISRIQYYQRARQVLIERDAYKRWLAEAKARSTPMAGAEPPKQGGAYRATDQVLDLLVAAGHITREKAFQCRDIWVQFFADEHGEAANRDLGAIGEQADAWGAVVKVLNGVSPGWTSLTDRGVDSACAAIRALANAAEPSPSVEPAPASQCSRSHPHEEMTPACELRTEIARLTNENARLKAAPHQEPGWADSGNPLCNHDGQPACNGCLYMGECMCAPKEPNP